MGYHMELSAEAIVAVISALGAGVCTLAGWLWAVAKKMAKYEIEHASHSDDISALTKEMREMRADQQRESTELRNVQREERHQLSKMSSKIDILISVMVSKSDAKLTLSDVMEMLDKQTAQEKRND